MSAQSNIHCKSFMQSNRCWRTRSVNVTTQNSPNKITKNNLHNTRSIDYIVRTESDYDLHKKSINDLRYYLQVYKKKMRSALISKNFQESNMSPQLSHNSLNSLTQKGMKGSKLQNKHKFRKNKFIEINEIGCIQPQNQFNITNNNNGVFKPRNNKPNLMYNLNLFRKKYSKEGYFNRISFLDKNNYQHSISNSKIINPSKKIKVFKTQHSKQSSNYPNFYERSQI